MRVMRLFLNEWKPANADDVSIYVLLLAKYVPVKPFAKPITKINKLSFTFL
jgi:hypothetical protein